MDVTGRYQAGRPCRFKNGRTDWNTRTIVHGFKCKFHHTNETIDEYYVRSGMTRPDLPLTNEHTRKIPEIKQEVNEKTNRPAKSKDDTKISRKAQESVRGQRTAGERVLLILWW
jgi:hypothetical protein